MAKVVKNTLGYLGVDFQYKLIAAFIERPKFFKDLYPIIDQNMFTESYLKTIVGVMKEYYAKYDITASYDIISIKLRDKAYSTEDVDYYNEAIEKLKNLSTEGIDEVEDMAERFFKQQNWVRVANEIKRIAGDGDMAKYDECQALIEQANTIGRKHNEGSSPLGSIDDDLSKESVVTIPTGVSKLDNCLGGGLDKGKVGLIMGSTSFGKVQPYDAIVMTPNGPTEMKNIVVGSEVLGCDGKPHKVIGVYPHKNWEFHKVTFSDGVSCECGMEHLWAVNSFYQRSGRKRVKGMPKKMYIPDNSYKVLSLEEILKKGLFKRGRHNFKIPMANVSEFSNKPILIDPYLMGYMIGDGNFARTTITVGSIDEYDIVSNLSTCGEEFKIKHYPQRATSIVFGSSTRQKLKEYFSLSNKSGDKYLPFDYIYNSIENRIALLNGLMDSDGTCQKNGCSCFNTKSERLANDVKTLVLSLGGFASVRTKHAGYFSKKYGKYIDCGIQYEVTISLCDDSIKIFRLDRKQERVIYRTKWKNNRFIHNVEFSRIADGQCIMIDSKDELYLTNDFIVTHNTSMTTGLAAYAASYQCNANYGHGFKVLQIVFEDSERDIHRKYFGRLTQIETKDINKDEETTAKVRELLMNHPDRDAIKNNICVMHLETGEYSATDIKREIKKKINEGFKPDMVIVDYLECINAEKGTTSLPKHEQETKTMRKFENMAKELDIALWLPTQGNRSSVTSELVTMDQGAGAFTKQQIAQVVISITRSVDDISNQRATLAILKNRSGSAGIVLNGIKFNNGTCTVSCDEVVDFSSPIAYNDYVDNQQANKRFESFL